MNCTIASIVVRFWFAENVTTIVFDTAFDAPGVRFVLTERNIRVGFCPERR